MCNKIKFTKAFPLVDLIPFWRREQSRSNRLPISDSTRGHFWLLVGSARGPVRSVGMGRRVHCSDDTVRGATDGPQVHTILHIVLFQLGQDVLAIRVLAESCNMGPDLGRKDSVCYAGLQRAWLAPVSSRPSPHPTHTCPLTAIPTGPATSPEL